MNSPILNALSKIWNVILVSILWLVGCIPIVTIGTSTAALYYTTVKVNRRDTGYLCREFINSYKMNVKQGIPATVLMLIVALVLMYNRYFMVNAGGTFGQVFTVVYTAMLVIVAALSCYVFPVLSRFHIKLKDLFKLSFYMCMRHILTTIVLLVMFVLAFLGVYYMLPALLFVPGLLCLVDSLLLEKVLLKYMEKPEEDSEEAVKWYYQ